MKFANSAAALAFVALAGAQITLVEPVVCGNGLVIDKSACHDTCTGFRAELITPNRLPEPHTERGCSTSVVQIDGTSEGDNARQACDLICDRCTNAPGQAKWYGGPAGSDGTIKVDQVPATKKRSRIEAALMKRQSSTAPVCGSGVGLPYADCIQAVQNVLPDSGVLGIQKGNIEGSVGGCHVLYEDQTCGTDGQCDGAMKDDLSKGAQQIVNECNNVATNLVPDGTYGTITNSGGTKNFIVHLSPA